MEIFKKNKDYYHFKVCHLLKSNDPRGDLNYRIVTISKQFYDDYQRRNKKGNIKLFVGAYTEELIHDPTKVEVKEAPKKRGPKPKTEEVKED